MLTSIEVTQDSTLGEDVVNGDPRVLSAGHTFVKHRAQC